MPTRFLALLAFLLPLTAQAAPEKPAAAQGGAPDIKAGILIVDSRDAIGKWAASPGEGDAGRMRKVARGTKILVPIVVTGLAGIDFGKPGLSADLEFVAPGGKVLLMAMNCCRAKSGDPRTPGLVVLDPVLDIKSQPGDPLGTYELRATLSYKGRKVAARETFELVAEQPKAAAVKADAAAPTKQPVKDEAAPKAKTPQEPKPAAQPAAAAPKPATAKAESPEAAPATDKAEAPKVKPAAERSAAPAAAPQKTSKPRGDARSCLEQADARAVARCAEKYR
jgi:hypothetical protein